MWAGELSDERPDGPRATLIGVRMKEIIVLVPARTFARLGLNKLEEGVWKPASERGYSYRIDPENPGARTMRHVHITMRGYTDRGHQISWNVDGSRHDRASTASKLTSVAAAGRIARDVLNLPNDVVLEAAATASEIANAARQLIEAQDYGADALDIPYFVLKDRALPVVRARLVVRARVVRARLVE